MGQSAEELRRDIAGTRQDLGETLDAIGDRVSPGRMIERRKNRISNGVQSVKERIMGTAQDAADAVATRARDTADLVTGGPDAGRRQTAGAPLAAGGVAFGVGFLVAAAFPPTRTEERAAEQVLEKVEPVKEQLVEAGQQVADHIREAAPEAVDQVKEAAARSGQEIADTARDATQASKEAVYGAADRVRDTPP